MKISSNDKLNIVKKILKTSSVEDKKNIIVRELKKLSYHQSGFFGRLFSSEIPHSLKYAIYDLTQEKYMLKEINDNDCNNTLKEICEIYLENNPNDFVIKNLLEKAKTKNLIKKADCIINSFYTRYGNVIKKNKFENGEYFFVDIDKSKESNSLKGKLKFSSGDIYSGLVDETYKPVKNGIGTLKFVNKNLFIGEVDKNGKPIGQGSYIFKSIYNNTFGNEFIGEIDENGKPIGQGRYIFKSVFGKTFGNEFIGEVDENGKPIGQGCYTFKSSGNIFYGEVDINGKPLGKGRYIFKSSGNEFIGEIDENGKPIKEGYYIFKSSGNIFYGEVNINGKPVGQGSYTFKSSGNIFYGEVDINGKPLGKGRYIFKSSGNVFYGEVDANGNPIRRKNDDKYNNKFNDDKYNNKFSSTYANTRFNPSKKENFIAMLIKQCTADVKAWKATGFSIKDAENWIKEKFISIKTFSEMCNAFHPDKIKGDELARRRGEIVMKVINGKIDKAGEYKKNFNTIMAM